MVIQNYTWMLLKKKTENMQRSKIKQVNKWINLILLKLYRLVLILYQEIVIDHAVEMWTSIRCYSSYL